MAGTTVFDNEADLAAAMTPKAAGALSLTSGWDVMVSYNLTQLNVALSTLWTTSSSPMSALSLVTETNDLITGNWYQITWNVTLGSPTLVFPADSGDLGTVQLTCGLSGSYEYTQITGQNGTPEGTPTTHPLPNGLSIEMIIPLAAVSANGNVITTKVPYGSSVTFDNDPSSSLHIVFDFDFTRGFAAFNLIGDPGNQPQFDGFKDGMMNWFSGTTNGKANFPAIEYALATIGNTPSPDSTTQYLTPQTIIFKTYSGTSSALDGPSYSCLSVYIQTVESGRAAGSLTPSFNMPTDSQTAMIPIPSDHTATVIISRDVFGTTFLAGQLAKMNATLNDTTVNTFMPDSIKLVDSQAGIVVQGGLNASAIENMSESSWWGGGFSTTSVNWDLSSPPIVLTIQDEQAMWKWKYKNSVSWEEIIPGAKASNGETDYKVKLDTTSSLFTATDAGDLTASVSLKQSDFTTTLSAVQGSIWAQIGGWQNAVPSNITTGLSKIAYPAFTATFDLNFLATTNVFAPGKQMINIASTADIKTPYDVILFGNISAT